jgi:hypothetical protein
MTNNPESYDKRDPAPGGTILYRNWRDGRDPNPLRRIGELARNLDVSKQSLLCLTAELSSLGKAVNPSA